MLKEKDTVHPGDKLKVELSVETVRSLRYVYIDDKRSGGFEPADNISGYEYGHNIYYYRSVRDAGYQFFAEYIPSGISRISYELIASQEGVFNNGVASLQCMYKPEIAAYSKSQIFCIK